MPNIDCPRCGEHTHLTYRGLCRKCYRALPENKSKENSYSRRWYGKHRTSEIEKNAEYRRLNRELFDWYHDRVRYGGLRKYLYERDGHKCVWCRVTEKKAKYPLQIHHIDGVSYHNHTAANNETDNLIVMCKSCHIKLHWHQRKNKMVFKSREEIVRSMAKVIEVGRNSQPRRKDE